MLDQKKLLITDTTMRDAHQSLLSTRVRTRDMVKGADGTAEILTDCFSLEMWGGATFDVAYRFLHESPWERLDLLREKIPNIPFQMLLRGANAVGYTNYPDNLIRAFVKEAAQLRHRRVPRVRLPELDARHGGGHGRGAQAGQALRGHHLLHRRHSGPQAGQVHPEILCEHGQGAGEARAPTCCAIKDMSGLLKPYAAKKLVSALKQEVGLPIHLHTHDTSGNQVAAYLMAAEAGVDIVDCAIASMSSLTSQPSMNAVVAALQGTGAGHRPGPARAAEADRLLGRRAPALRAASKPASRAPPPTSTAMRSPAASTPTCKPQVESLGLGHRFEEVKEMYKHRQRDAGRHREGDALLQDGGRSGHLHGAERPDPGEHRGARARHLSLPRLRVSATSRA